MRLNLSYQTFVRGIQWYEDLLHKCKSNASICLHKGIYEAANVYLDGNNLTRFDSDVYLPILEQMIDVEGGIDNAGFINVEGSNYIYLFRTFCVKKVYRVSFLFVFKFRSI